MHRRSALALALALGLGFSATAHALRARLDLTVSQVVPGQNARVTVTGLNPGDDVAVFLSTVGPGPGPCGPGGSPCLSIGGPVREVARGTANASGWASVVVPVPAGAPNGAPFSLQAASSSGRVSDVESQQVGPVACLRIYSPVCGIDQQTYSNECEANAFGWPVDYLGPC